MRPWTLPIVGAVALSLAIPSAAQARLRFGPGAVLGAFAGAMFGGFHYAGETSPPTCRHACIGGPAQRGAFPTPRRRAAIRGGRAATPGESAASAAGYIPP